MLIGLTNISLYDIIKLSIMRLLYLKMLYTGNALYFTVLAKRKSLIKATIKKFSFSLHKNHQTEDKFQKNKPFAKLKFNAREKI